MSGRMNISSGSPWESQVGYSRVVRVGHHIEIAGTTAIKDGKPVEVGDAYGQTICVLKIIQDALAQVGATLYDVVRTRIFVTDIAKWEEIGRAHGEFFGDIRPVSTMVEVKSLIRPEFLVEIEAEAIVATTENGVGP